ncbi:MAG: type II secretion system protein [Verrucomicrobiales bacterium]|nr:type II secretion system protein [Verrucomicrobiales bacterium]
MHPPRTERAFTLLEVLVVVAILGILASLLLPTLARSRDSARTAVCTSQLRQFGLAAQMYWDDQDGCAFRYRGPATNGGDLYWFGWIERGAEGSRRFDPAQGALWRYLPEARIQTCPSLPAQGRRLKPKAATAAGGYGYNLTLSAPLDRPLFRISSATRPTELAVFADSAQINTFQAPASPENPMVEPFFYVSTNEATAHFRHAAAAAVVFVDGHVAREQPEPDSLDPRLPDARIARLRTRILVLP